MENKEQPVVVAAETSSFHRSLREILDRAGPIDPWRRTLRDSAVLYGIMASVSTGFMFVSGYFDQLSVGMVADHNYWRMAQGLGATLNVLTTTALCLIGRYRTYTDLADFQRGVIPVETIIARADKAGMGKLKRAADWTLHNAFNINACVSFPLCAAMAASGIMSGRIGEAITAAMLVPVYVAQLLPEREEGDANKPKVEKKTQQVRRPLWRRLLDIEAAAGRLVQRIPVVRSMPPLLVSSVIAKIRLAPMAVSALAKGDAFQMGQYVTSLAMYVFKADTTKDGIGRHAGSIVSPKTPRALRTVETLMVGGLKRTFSRFSASEEKKAARRDKKALSYARLNGWTPRGL